LKAEVTSINSWKRKLDVEASPEEFGPQEEKAVAAFQKKVHLDGFRKGKAPLQLIRRQFAGELKESVSETLAIHFLREAIQEKNLFPIATPVIQKVDYEEGVRLSFSGEMEVEPEVRLKDYTGLKLEKEIVKTTREDVLNTIETLRNEHASFLTVEGGADAGHIVEGDIQALESTGIPVIGKKWENRGIELGVSHLGKMVQDQLIGVKVGEERRFKVVEPERGQDGKVREQEKHYSIRVKSVKNKSLPDLADDFAKKVGDFETVAKMEEGLQKFLEAQREKESAEQLENRISTEIVQRNDFELPPSMVENGLGVLYEDHVRRTQQQPDPEEFRKAFMPLVQRSLKWDLLWHKIAEAESIAVGEEEIDQWIQKVAEADPKNEKRVRSIYKEEKRRHQLKENLLNNKVIEYIKNHSKIKEVTVKDSKQAPSSIITP
jgi:trigger factor